jgi:hypothetical protein
MVAQYLHLKNISENCAFYYEFGHICANWISYFWVSNGVETLRGPCSKMKYKSIIYPLIHPVFNFFLYLDLLGSVSFTSVGQSNIYHWQWMDSFFVSMCMEGWCLWHVAPGLKVLAIGMFVCNIFPNSSFSFLSHMFSVVPYCVVCFHIHVHCLRCVLHRLI